MNVVLIPNVIIKQITQILHKYQQIQQQLHQILIVIVIVLVLKVLHEYLCDIPLQTGIITMESTLTNETKIIGSVCHALSFVIFVSVFLLVILTQIVSVSLNTDALTPEMDFYTIINQLE